MPVEGRAGNYNGRGAWREGNRMKKQQVQEKVRGAKPAILVPKCGNRTPPKRAATKRASPRSKGEG